MLENMYKTELNFKKSYEYNKLLRKISQKHLSIKHF